MNYDSTPAGPALDALIAEKVMGWKISEPKERDHGRAWLQADGQSTGYQLAERPPFDWDMEYFRPSTDIAAAWEVVEKIKADGKSWWFADCNSDGCVNVSIPHMPHRHGSKAAIRRHCETETCNYVMADTMPLAICRVALQMVMG